MRRPLQAVIYLTWVVSMGVHVGLVQEVQTADLLVCSESGMVLKNVTVRCAEMNGMVAAAAEMIGESNVHVAAYRL